MIAYVTKVEKGVKDKLVLYLVLDSFIVSVASDLHKLNNQSEGLLCISVLRFNSGTYLENCLDTDRGAKGAGKAGVLKINKVCLPTCRSRILRGIHEIGETRGKLIMCLRSGSRMFTFWIQNQSVAHLPPSPISTPTSLRPRHFYSHSHLRLIYLKRCVLHLAGGP